MLELINDGKIAQLILNRPEKHNAFDDELIARLISALEKISRDSSLRVLLLSARGKSFSAGADLKWMQRMADYSRDENIRDAALLGRLMQLLNTLPLPIIGIIQGPTYGGGVGLAACCDLLLATPAARFCLSEVKLGLIPAVISPYVIKALGERRARRLFVTAEIFSAEQAYHWGLVDEVYAEIEIEAKAMEWARALIKNGPEAMRYAKELVRMVAGQPLDDELISKTVHMIADRRASAEAKSGLNAFFDKTQPEWMK